MSEEFLWAYIQFAGLAILVILTVIVFVHSSDIWWSEVWATLRFRTKRWRVWYPGRTRFSDFHTYERARAHAGNLALHGDAHFIQDLSGERSLETIHY